MQVKEGCDQRKGSLRSSVERRSGAFRMAYNTGAGIRYPGSAVRAVAQSVDSSKTKAGFSRGLF